MATTALPSACCLAYQAASYRRKSLVNGVSFSLHFPATSSSKFCTAPQKVPFSSRFGSKLSVNPPPAGSYRGQVSVRASIDYEALRGIEVFKAATGEAMPLLSLWDGEGGSPAVIAFLTHFGDLSSWEYAQKLKEKVIPALESGSSPALIVLGLGSLDNARKFSEVLNFPVNLLYADPEGLCYSALGFSKGFGAELEISPYLKLLPMLMGIGSPGTIQEVARGYVGDRSSPAVFSSATPFDILGTGYQRPFELATLRLSNMVGILPRWGDLSPPKETLLTQQGGTIVFNGDAVAFKHVDTGILKYTDVAALLDAVGSLPKVTVDV